MASLTTSQTSLILLLMLFATAHNRSIYGESNNNNNEVVRCNKKDQEALLMFKEGVVDPRMSLISWSSEEDCCAWVGVLCDNITGRVTQLHLANGYYLQGEINLSLLQLEFLNHLDLSLNYFEALTISHPSVNFSNNLQYLDLSRNYYLHINDLHWLSQLSSLTYLDLSGVDIGNETKWLQYMAMLPSLSKLRLSNCGLGNIMSPSYFPNFTSLTTLDLSNNNLELELSNLLHNITSDISYLYLGMNKFKGEIPIALLRFQNLKGLNLWSNQLTGPIPSSLGNLSSLVYLDLSSNHLVGILSEANFCNLSNLKSLNLGSNGFEFDFDPNWVPPFQLDDFGSSNTSLGPNFPTWLYTQKSLNDLDLSSSGLSFIADDMFWSFIGRIQTVYLSENSISGDLSNVTINTANIRLDHNNFTGSLPYLSPNVDEFRASHNSFSGSLFPLLCHHQESHAQENMLSTLEIPNNHLTGSLPDCWANWKQLDYLNFGSNKLTGEVPPSMATLSNLGILDLHDNNFFGNFSLDLSNWTNLQYLLLEGNKFSGNLPNTMHKGLVVLELRSNQFTGNIPPQICDFPSLMVLDLAENRLSGSIPHCVYNIMVSINEPLRANIIDSITKGQKLEFRNIWMLRSFDVSANNLSGEIPRELFRVTQMISLNLSRNRLTGKIPEEIGGMKNLESLDLSYNKLFGEIPQAMSGLSFLAYLNLSYNSFTGQIPLGTQIQSFEAWSFIGNSELCGAPLLPMKCTKKEGNKEPKAAEEDDGFLKSLYLGMGVGFAVGFWGASGSLFIVRPWRHRFFKLVNRLEDWIYVSVALKFNRFRRG